MSSKKIKILLVEDHIIAQKVGVMIFQQFNYAVDAAASGAETLEYIANTAYDIIFMDIGLPDIDGFSLVKQIRQQENINQATPIVALTAHSDQATQDKAKLYGMDGFLIKPLTVENSESSINTFVKKAK